MTDRDERLDRAIVLLKEPVSVDPALDMRVMAEIESLPARHSRTHSVGAVFDWLKRGRPVRISPLGGLALAAAVAALVVWSPLSRAPVEPSLTALAAPRAATVQFVMVAPTATEVYLVGDFNDWNPSATPMELVADNRVWSVTIPLDAGRYRYAFLVNGDTWLSDPSAPPVGDDEFGRPGSVVTIGET